MHPKDLSIEDFTYTLPEERIAKYPLAERDQSKCLILTPESNIEQDIYANIYRHIPAGSLMVFNDTKVVEARLKFKKDTGSVIELFCLEPDERYADITQAMLQQKEVYWKCLIGGAKKWKSSTLTMQFLANGQPVVLYAEKLEKHHDYYSIHFHWDVPALSFAEVLHHAGILPLPPYLKRDTEKSDLVRYQTVYAEHDGSVAAPTAGLHFTKSLLERIKEKNIDTDFVTLHVGAGTFKPVKAEKMQDHEMHYEAIDVNRSLIENIVHHMGNPVIAVGTTSLRTLETLYWIGVKLSLDHNIKNTPEVEQWDPYSLPHHLSAGQSLQVILDWMQLQGMTRLITRTQIIIAPGYQLKIADAIVTNFHQPQSTLILLVAAVIGDRWRSVYQYALSHDFRFLSYGDGSLLWKQKEISQ